MGILSRLRRKVLVCGVGSRGGKFGVVWEEGGGELVDRFRGFIMKIRLS